MGSVNGFERPLIEQSGVTFDAYNEVMAGPLHGVSFLRLMSSLVKLAVGLLQGLVLIVRHRPQTLLLTGGWVGFPMAVAAWLLRVPILIFLPDIEPALSIKVLRRLARRVAIAIPESAQYFPQGQTVVTGYPVRQSLSQATREHAHTTFGLNPNLKTVLVFGGSRGAQTINTAIVSILPRLMADEVQVLHVTGELDWERVQAETTPHPNYHPKAYLHGEQMGLALAAADLVVSRSGAGALGEFPVFSLPAILVPYPYAWRYQKVNADYLSERGAAIYMPDEEMQAKLYDEIHRLFTNDEQLATMQRNMRQLAQPDSAEQIAAELRQLTGE